MRRLLILTLLVIPTCSVSIAAQNKARRATVGQPIRPMVRKVIEDMTRIIEAYASTRSMRGTRPRIAGIRSETKAVSLRMSRYPDLAEHLDDASGHLLRAELVFQASTSKRKMGEEESMAFTEMTDMFYNCPDAPLDVCIQIIMDEARKSQRAAFNVAVGYGFYSP